MDYQDNNGYETNSANYHYTGDPEHPYEEPEVRQKKNTTRRVTAMILTVAITLGAVLGVGFAAKSVFGEKEREEKNTDLYFSDRENVTVNPVTVTGGKELSYAELYAANVNSCVSINVSTKTTNVFGQTALAASSGSGFIISKDGYIVTNYHVINGGSAAKVTLYDNTTYDAKIIGGDEEYDIAVLKIEADNLTPVVIGSSANLLVGSEIAIIGNPLGELTFSLSEGIVSCVDRLINVDGTPFNMIQLTAAVNAGNSGGPLFNRYGEVVGIVSAKYSSSGSGASVEGLGFAIPINDVIAMIEDIMSNGYVTNKPYLGVSAGTFDQRMIPGSTVSAGVYLYSVEAGSAAAKAGLLAGDILVKIDEHELSTMNDLTSVKKYYSAGDTVTVEYYRGNQPMTASLTFDATPENTMQPQAEPEQQMPQQQMPNRGNGNNGGSYDPWDFFEYYFGDMFG